MNRNGQTSIPKPIRDALRLPERALFDVATNTRGQVVFTPKDLTDRQVVEAYRAADTDDKACRAARARTEPSPSPADVWQRGCRCLRLFRGFSRTRAGDPEET